MVEDMARPEDLVEGMEIVDFHWACSQIMP